MADFKVKENSYDAQELFDLEKKQRIIDRNPFKNMKIDNTETLNTIEGRKICSTCHKSRKFFCYTCYVPVIDKKYVPRVKLPIKIDIIKHVREIDGKSTAIHAAVLAPEDVCIYTYPDFPETINKEETVLIFPDKTALSIEEFFKRKINAHFGAAEEKFNYSNFIPKKAIFIDSTWHQTKSIYSDPRLEGLPCLILKSRISQFWRNQKKSPRWYLATIEAIHQFLIEFHTSAHGLIEFNTEIENCLNKNIEEDLIKNRQQMLKHQLSNFATPYDGQYDNLLYFFKCMYDKIHSIYDHDKLWAYKRPLI